MKYTHISYVDKPLYIDPTLKTGGNIGVTDDFGADISWGEEVEYTELKIIVLDWRFGMVYEDGKDAVRYRATDTFHIIMEENKADIEKIEALIDDSASNFIKGWSNRKRNTLVMRKIITPPSIQAKANLTTQIHTVLSHKG